MKEVFHSDVVSNAENTSQAVFFSSIIRKPLFLGTPK
jgi:hypothetical protein